jgi:hypothetical protein
VLARASAADEDAPVIPWALRRCAPSAAARANDLPHSGQMNSPDPCLLALRVRGLGLLALRVRELGLLAPRVRELGLVAPRVRELGLLAPRVRGLCLVALRVRGLTSPVLLTRQLRELRMPAYAEGGVSAPLIAAASDNNRQRLRARTRRAKPCRNQPVLALGFASAAARAPAQGRFHESRRRPRLTERRAVRQCAARAAASTARW